MDLPARFGKYELLSRIAEGGMAEIFLARSFGVAGFEKRLAIKRIKPELAEDPRFVSMFINEAKISVHLHHPNVVQVFDLGKVGNSYFIAMEHLHGRDLSRMVKALRAQHVKLPVETSVAIVADVCRGLAYAHSRSDHHGQSAGLVHRDVSPHNVLVTYTGEVKLVDFGIARLMHTAQGRTEGSHAGRPGGGKYAYMSPEQSRGEDVDQRSDVFSAGIVLWELIVGHRLYDHSDPDEKLKLVRAADIPHPAEEGVEVDDSLWAILRRALARDREDRYPDAAELEEDLRAWLFEQGHRIGPSEISAWMRSAFPDEASRAPEDIALSKVIQDLDRLDALTSYTPTPDTLSSGSLRTEESLPGHLLEPQGERKDVFVLMVDVDGFTTLSAGLDPEELFSWQFRFLRWLARETRRFGGTLQRVVDDQVLILFGVPRTRDDDLRRCLSCALELQTGVPSLAQQGLHLRLAMGVHHGGITMLPGHRRRNMVPRGDTTRLARRLSALADHNQVLLSRKVARMAGARFSLQPGPDLRNRGGEEPLPTFALQARRSPARTLAPGRWLRGREELGLLRGALQDLARGQGASIAISSDTGGGKSRLVREVQGLARRRGMPMYIGRTDASTEPLAGFADLARSVLHLEQGASSRMVRSRLDDLRSLELHDDAVQAIAALLGASRLPPTVADAAEALGQLLCALSSSAPLIAVLEDVHALPYDQQAWLGRWVDMARSDPLLLVFTHRGNVPLSLEGRSQPIVLEALTRDQQVAMVGSLLGTDRIDPAILELVHRSCQGNPGYLAEVITYLVDTGKVTLSDGVARPVGPLDDPSALPHTLTGLLAARVDELDAAAKGTLQVAAAIGPDFSKALLAEAVGVPALEALLERLVVAGLIEPDPGDEGEYHFATPLIHRTVVRGVMSVQRRGHHRMVAGAMERLYADELEDHLEALARHCGNGERALDAVRYAYRAGQQLEQQGFLGRAERSYRQGLVWLAQVPGGSDTWDARVQGEASLNLRLGIVQARLGNGDAAERAFTVALDVSADSGLPWIEAGALAELGRIAQEKGNLELARARLEQALALANTQDDPELMLDVVEATAELESESGALETARSQWERALDIARGPVQKTRALLGLSGILLRLGDIEQAVPQLERALRLARRNGDRILEGRALNNIGLSHFLAERYDDALSSFRSALRVREGIGYRRGVVINHHNIGDVHLAMGQLSRAHVAFSRSRDLALGMGWDRGAVLNEVYLHYIDLALGDMTGLEALDGTVARARELGDLQTALNGEVLAGRALIEVGRYEEARPRLRATLDEARKLRVDLVVETAQSLLNGEAG